MQPDFERTIETQRYFAATFVAVFRVLLHQRRRQGSRNHGIIAQPAERPTSLDLQSVYCDPDPPTPHWGC